MNTIKLGEFFSGPGGIALGAHQAAQDISLQNKISLEHTWAFDIDADSCATYRTNIPGASESTVQPRDVLEFLNPEKVEALNDIDGFAFGFPCNDFSLVGQHKGLEGRFGGLYKTGISVLQGKKPKWFVAENVGGIRSANNGQAFTLILNELAEDYVLTPHLYKFEEYGVPQARHRVIIVGIRKDLASSGIKFKVPRETHAHPDLASERGLKPFVTAGSSLGLKYAPETQHTDKTRQAEHVRRRLSFIRPGENAFDAAERMPEELRLNVKGAFISQIYKKLREDRPAYTVTGSGGGGTHMYHWAEDRALTNRERARLQTFPDTFNFSGSRESIRKQIGMAVPVEGARVIFLALFKSFLGEDYADTEPNLMHFVNQQLF